MEATNPPSTEELLREITRLRSDLAKADRRAGAAERENADLRESAQARARWLERMKEEAGYHSNVSFDIIWEETLRSARQAGRERLLEAARIAEEVAQRYAPSNPTGPSGNEQIDRFNTAYEVCENVARAIRLRAEEIAGPPS